MAIIFIFYDTKLSLFEEKDLEKGTKSEILYLFN